MKSNRPIQLPVPVYVRLIAALVTLVVSGLGLLAIISGHTADRYTRMGYAPPLEGSSARAFGLAIFFFGLAPLMLLARTPRTAMRFLVVVVTLSVSMALLFGYF